LIERNAKLDNCQYISAGQSQLSSLRSPGQVQLKPSCNDDHNKARFGFGAYNLMGLVKKILGAVLGLFAGLAGLLGLGKKADSYYLDLSSGAPQAPAQVAQAQPKTPTAVATKAAPAAKVAPAQSSAKREVAAAPAAVAAVSNAATVIPAITFADMAAIPVSTSGRRLPGPSLDAFKTMAKEVSRRG
jgi:hypothetical protein